MKSDEALRFIPPAFEVPDISVEEMAQTRVLFDDIHQSLFLRFADQIETGVLGGAPVVELRLKIELPDGSQIGVLASSGVNEVPAIALAEAPDGVNVRSIHAYYRHPVEGIPRMDTGAWGVKDLDSLDTEVFGPVDFGRLSHDFDLTQEPEVLEEHKQTYTTLAETKIGNSPVPLQELQQVEQLLQYATPRS